MPVGGRGPARSIRGALYLTDRRLVRLGLPLGFYTRLSLNDFPGGSDYEPDGDGNQKGRGGQTPEEPSETHQPFSCGWQPRRL